MRREKLTITGRTACRYPERGLDINHSQYEACEFYEEQMASFRAPFVDVDGTIIRSDEDWFGVAPKVGMPGPGLKGFPAPTEGGKTCSFDDLACLSYARPLAYQGRWSVGARKRFRKCCDILFQAAIQTWEKHPSKDTRFPFQVAFLTLTITATAGYISPKEAHKNLLKPFLRWLREKGINGYCWVREFQPQTGMIHYHLVYDKFILKTELNRYWNSLLKRAGYLDAYFDKYGNYDPPSTRVDKAQNPEHCAWYMEKYMTKAMKDKDLLPEEYEDAPIDTSGKLWDASLNLKAGKPFCIDWTPEIENCLNAQVEAGKADMKVVDYVTLYFARRGSLLSLLPKKIQQDALIHYRKILYAGTPLEPPSGIYTLGSFSGLIAEHRPSLQVRELA